MRQAIDSREVYNEFLKLVNLFTQEIIDMRRLVEQSRTFLGEELLAQFKDILGWDSGWEGAGAGNGSGGGHGEGMERLTKEHLSIRHGPSYRRLPASVCLDHLCFSETKADLFIRRRPCHVLGETICAEVFSMTNG